MNCIQKMLAAALGCVLSALLLTGCGEKEEPVNITLANHSGHGITSISITPSTSDESAAGCRPLALRRRAVCPTLLIRMSWTNWPAPRTP